MFYKMSFKTLLDKSKQTHLKNKKVNKKCTHVNKFANIKIIKSLYANKDGLRVTGKGHFNDKETN